MKKPILKLIAFSVLPFLVVCYAVYITGKTTDTFYKRFTSPTQNSLILGSSRSAYMNPKIIDEVIHQKYPNANLYNYSFTWAHSPYGPKYLESIQKKLKPETRDGVFIVTVEPTALMVDKNHPDSPEYYVENDKSVAKTSMVATNPNIEYLIESYDYSITRELNNIIKPEKNVVAKIQVLDNGKVDINILKPNSPEKQAEVNKGKMAELVKKMDGLKISENRISYLIKTIEFLKQHGKVIVMRIPISKVPYSIENKVFPDFDQRMMNICAKEELKYINYNKTPNNYKWFDEVHLDPVSVNKFSKIAAEDIIKYK